MLLRIIAPLAFLAATATAALADCGRTDPPCEVDQGTYRIALPDGPAPNGGYPHVMFLHGAGGTSRGVLGMAQMVQPLLDRGYAVIAPQGLSWLGGEGGIWSFLPETTRPRARDEAAFFASVLSDAQVRHGLSKEKGMLAGFSAGGFMVSYLACETPNAFLAYAPVAGGFWRPHPKECAGPVRLLHTHGWTDRTVPLEGRPLGDRFLQGDIFEGLALWRGANSCASPAPSGVSQSGAFLRRKWDCAPGFSLELALYPGGHRVPEGWADMALDWMEGLAQVDQGTIPPE